MTARVPDAVAPPAGEPAATPPRRRLTFRLGKRGVIIASITAGALVIGGIAAAGVAWQRDLDSAHLELELALQDRDDAEARHTSSRSSYESSLTAAQDAVLTMEAVLALTGEGLDPAAHDALAATAASVTVTAEEFPSLLPAPASTSTNTTAAQLRAQAASELEWVGVLTELSDAYDAASASVFTVTDTLHAALAAHAQATAAVGTSLLTDRADASDETKTALQLAIDGLGTAEPADAAVALGAYLAAAASVIASSNEARAPRAPTGGEGGGGYRIPDPASLTAVVNKTRSLSAAYAPGDLRRPAGVGNALPLRDAAASAAERMAADMAAAGITLRMSSGYRSYSRQVTVYGGFVAREGVAGADEHSARPGHSEHQTGLAADFDDGTGCNLKVCFRDRAGGVWLAAHAWEYGWIPRYGDGWQPTVGFRFEPWHYRYVGVETSTDMHNRGIVTLEDYFGTGAAPGYLD